MSPSRPPARLAAAVSINLSTSSFVRCSRVRSSALGRRTVRFTVAGDCKARGELSIAFAPSPWGLFRLQLFYERLRMPPRFPKKPSACQRSTISLASAISSSRWCGEVGLGADSEGRGGRSDMAAALGLGVAAWWPSSRVAGQGVGGEGHACAELGLMLRDSGGDWLPRLCAIQCLR